MLTDTQRAEAAGYLAFKASVSAVNDHLLPNARRVVVPPMTPVDAAKFYHDDHNNPYTGDPVFGVVDFYTNPNRLQAGLVSGSVSGLFIDCDDVAGWYHTAVRQTPGYTSRVVTLIDHRIVGSHVICPYMAPDGTHGVLDTNGHHILPDLEESTICDFFTNLYKAEGYVYLGMLDSPYPF